MVEAKITALARQYGELAYLLVLIMTVLFPLLLPLFWVVPCCLFLFAEVMGSHWAYVAIILTTHQRN